MTAYLAYLAGDVFGFSGILALFVCAVAISHYALHNISGALGMWAEGGMMIAGNGAAVGSFYSRRKRTGHTTS